MLTTVRSGLLLFPSAVLMLQSRRRNVILGRRTVPKPDVNGAVKDVAIDVASLPPTLLTYPANIYDCVTPPPK